MVDDIRAAFKNGYKAPCVVAPCGAGKSVVISEIAKMTTNKKNYVLFLVHRRELIDQIRSTFIKNGVDMDYVILGMVQTIINRLKKIPKPSLIITDENHHAKAGTYRKIYDYFSDVLRLGFTATPIRLNGEGLQSVNDVLVPSVSVEWLIENNRLAPYEYYTFEGIDSDKLRKSRTGEYSNRSINESLNKTIYGDVLKNYIEKGKNGQAIVYCHSIEFSESVVKMFNGNGIVAAHIDAKTNKKNRYEIIQAFRDKKIRILSNVDLIGEGFDVPDCSVVILLRPTASLSLFIQQSMRSMRYMPNKTAIILDHVCNCRKHGLPSTERIWSLEGKKKKNHSRDQDRVDIWICECCYAVNPKKEKVCQVCKKERQVENQGTGTGELKNDKTANLKQVTKDDFFVVMDFRKPSDCRNMKELQELAKNLGYKPGWAYYKAKELGFIK